MSRQLSVSNALSPLDLGELQLKGRVGEALNSVVNARITSELAEKEICPEAVEAFRNRVDDRLETDRGLWQGEFWGKWILSAIAAHRYTGQNKLKDLIRQAVTGLLATQRADGYIGTYEDSGFVFSVDDKQNWNVWCRKYTLWGLLEAYDLLRDPVILNAAVRFMDHLASEVGPGKAPIVETGKFAGLPSSSILTPVVMLYRLTREQRFLDYAEYIVAQWSSREGQPPDLVNKGLTGEPVHKWFPKPESWTKAYELISCIEGLVDLHRITGNDAYLNAVVHIHRNIVEHERTIFGGIGRNDKMIGARYLAETEAEICDAVYWQRLSFKLLCLTGEQRYADEIERTMYNTLCAAMKSDGTWGVRRLCCSGEHWPAPQHCHLKHHHCCVDNLPRGLLQLTQTAIMYGQNGITLNLFLPGRARVPLLSGRTVKLSTETVYPAAGTIKVTVDPEQAEAIPIHVRIPPWSAESSLKINGEDGPECDPGSYAVIERTWESGDTIELKLDMRGRVTRLARNPDASEEPPPRVAIERGPLVLARDMRLENGDVHAPVSLPSESAECVELTAAVPPEGMWLAFQSSEVKTTEGKPLLLCDFASAGQSWDKETSDFRLWMPVKE